MHIHYNRSTTDQIFFIQKILKTVYDGELHQLFIDFKKPMTKVGDFIKFWIPKKFIMLIKMCMHDESSVVDT
jgi:hypothetical protein